jgi:integrase
MLEEPKRRERWLMADEKNRLFKELPEHLIPIAAFALATGLRKANVAGLQWSQVDIRRRTAWIYVDQTKSSRAIGVPLNEDAMSIILSQRGKHKTNVFTYKGNPIKNPAGTAWKNARGRAANEYERITGAPANKGFKNLRVHDLKHTFGHRLRVAGVYREDRKDLLGHRSDKSVTTHYSAPTLERMIELANKVLETDPQQRKSLTIIRKKAA